MNPRKIVQKLLEWFAGSARDLPWRRTRDPYGIWVSEIMLQQTRVNAVLPYWERWMRALPDIATLARAKPAVLHKLWEGLGYYSRVRNLQRAAQQVVDRHGGIFPRSFADVLALPGIGRYTAGAICSIAFNQPQPIVDGNVMRVLTRLFGIAGNPRAGKTNAALWLLAEELVRLAADARALAPAPHSARACAQFNQALMELGAMVCTPRQPLCSACPVATWCVAHREGRTEQLPALAPRARPTQRRFIAFVTENRNRTLVRQRPADAVNAHLWEFPNIEVSLDDGDPREAARIALGVTPKALQPFLTVRHSITRYRITLEAYRVSNLSPAKVRRAAGQWVDQRRLSRLAFTAAHKRILQRLNRT